MLHLTCEVFDSEGTLAIQSRETEQDYAHVRWVDRTTATDEFADPTWRELTDEERDEILGRIAEALTAPVGIERKAVRVVFDLETYDFPFPLGLYERTDEDVVIYRDSRDVRAAPADCVQIVTVLV